MQMWVFDMGDQDTGRLLRSRIGHPTPPRSVKWFGSSLVITGGDNCLRSQKVMADAGTREFGVASQIKKHNNARTSKLPPIIDFAFSMWIFSLVIWVQGLFNDSCIDPLKQKDWDDVLTCHENSNAAHTWSTKRVCLGAHSFTSSEARPTPIKVMTRFN